MIQVLYQKIGKGTTYARHMGIKKLPQKGRKVKSAFTAPKTLGYMAAKALITQSFELLTALVAGLKTV